MSTQECEANVLSACVGGLLKTITSSAPSTASRLVRAKEIFVPNGMMKQGRVGARVGFDGIRDLKSGQILPCRRVPVW
jgi:hypothetical protein